MTRLKYLAKVRSSNLDKKSKDNEIPVRLVNYTDVYYNDRITNDMEFMTATASVEELDSFRLRAGDVIITKDSETPDDIGVPAFVEQSADDMVCGYHLALIRPYSEIVYPRFLHYWAMSDNAKIQFSSVAFGLTRYGLRLGAIGSTTLHLPPLPEQRAIADYLDHQTALMDSLVAKKQRMIELLAERRQSLITHAVTKGLDPQAPTRESRTEPMIRLHHLITVSSGARIPFYPEDEHSAVSIGGEHIQKHQFSLGDKTRFVPLSFYLGQKSGHIQEGDTLVVKDGATIGKSMFVDHMPAEHMMVNEHVFVLRAVAIDPRYLSFLIQSKTTQDTIWSLNVAAAQPGLSKDFVKFIRVPVADLKEQHAIADYLDRQTAIMDALTEKLNRRIELLAERRQSLITHAVTGKIDVRRHNVPATPA